MKLFTKQSCQKEEISNIWKHLTQNETAWSRNIWTECWLETKEHPWALWRFEILSSKTFSSEGFPWSPERKQPPGSQSVYLIVLLRFTFSTAHVIWNYLVFVFVFCSMSLSAGILPYFPRCPSSVAAGSAQYILIDKVTGWISCMAHWS